MQRLIHESIQFINRQWWWWLCSLLIVYCDYIRHVLYRAADASSLTL